MMLEQRLIFNYYFYCRFFIKLLSKFVKKGKRSTIENIFLKFFKDLKRRKNSLFMPVFLKALFLLKPLVGAKIWKFSKNKRAKKRKKGMKLQLQVKVIPINLSRRAQIKQALKWFFLRLKKSNLPLNKSFFIELFLILRKSKNSALQEKTNHLKLVVQNRGASHYRW